MILALRLKLTIRNERRRPVILARQPWPPFSDRVSRSAEDGERGLFLASFVGSEIYSEADARRIPKVSDGAAPDSAQFVILAPGEHHQAELTVRLPVWRKSAANRDEPIVSGSAYAYQADIELWPFRLTPENEIADLFRRWRSIGDLVVDRASTNFVPFRTSEPGTIDTCNGTLDSSLADV
jgi:hypothetical protein